MRQFLLKLGLVTCVLWLASYLTTPFFSRFQIGAFVSQAIRDVQNNSVATKLILGDSTGNMLFRNEKTKRNHSESTECIATTNYGVTLFGQWLLMKEFCETRSHSDSTEINLIFHPGSFSAGFHSKYTYHYFHLPFSDLFWKQKSCEIPKELMHIQVLLKLLPPLHLMRHSPLNIKDGQSLSMNEPIALTRCALNEIKILEDTYPVKIRILPPPLHNEWKEKNISSVTEILCGAQLFQQSSEYQNAIEFWPDSEDWLDNAHLKRTAITPKNWMNLLN